MQEVTAIKSTRRDPGRMMILVEDEVVATLPIARITDMGIVVGTNWTPALAANVDQAVSFDKAKRASLNRLNRRAMTCQQLKRKLRTLDHCDSVINEVIDHLKELGLLDDESVGRAIVRSELSRKPAGPMYLRAKLMQKGVEREVIDRIVSEATEEIDLLAGAKKLVASRLRSLMRVDEVTRKRRLWGMLARRGFDSDTIRRALSELPVQEVDEYF
jgi:regulatory protein